MTEYHKAVALLQTVTDMAAQLDYDVHQRETAEAIILDCNLAPYSPMSLRFVLNKSENDITLNGTVRTTGLIGDKTDVHDILSSLWALYLRLDAGISVRLISTILDDILPDEIYARHLIFTQPALLSLRETDLETIRIILQATLSAGMNIQRFMVTVVTNPATWGEYQEDASNQQQQLLTSSLKSAGVSIDVYSHYSRRNPDWQYFRLTKQNLSISMFDQPVYFDRSAVAKNLKLLTGINDVIIFSDGKATRNSVPKKRITLARKISTSLLNLRSANPLIVPIDSDLLVLAENHFIRIPTLADYNSYLRERERLILRRQNEANVINASMQFEWSSQIDDDEFEAFVYELLMLEPGVARVRKVSSGREQDRGRDMMVDWYLATNLSQISGGGEKTLYKLHHLIVQCKAFNRSVNKSYVTDIRDTIDRHKADGYFLVVSSTITTGLYDYLDELRSRRSFYIEWWTRVELEDRLRRNPDVALRFSRIVTPKPF
jgi:hypothetical protein